MKKLLMLGLLLFASIASAAIIQCEYQERSCDTAGNHFSCVMHVWGDGEFCSATDVSTHKRTNPPSKCSDDPKDCSYYICRHRWPPAYCD
jgi:hypothetical protein